MAKKKNRPVPHFKRSGCLALSLVVLFLVGALYMHFSNWISVDVPERALTETQKEEIIQAMTDWDQRYGHSRPIRVSLYQDPDIKNLPTGEVITTLAIGGPGYMLINPSQEGSLRFTVLHEMTHADKPDQPLMLDEPISFSDGQIIGYHGLSVLVRLRDGTETKFQLFEEGMAERNASYFPSYTVAHGGYFAIGNLTRSFFPNSGQDLVRNNDVPGFVARVLSLEKSEIGGREIEHVMSLYQRTFHQP